MNVEDAIDELKSIREYGEFNLCQTTCNALDMAIEALKKQIPKSVINRKVWEHVAKTFDTCPNCKEIVGESERYCHWCGQMIDWHKYCD